MKNSEGEPAGYVIRIGLNNIANPILAFSDEGNWDITNSLFEDIFFERADCLIAEEIGNSISLYGINSDECETELLNSDTDETKKQCNMNLRWLQGPSPYNSNLPNCAINEGMGGRVPAGCVAVALGQIMAFHERPSSGYYNSPISGQRIATLIIGL